MTETKSALDQAVDLFVYAPIGLAVAARDLVPTLAERGRQQLDPQVGVARMVGQLAVAQGRNQAEKAVERALAQARATLQQLGILPDEPGAGPREGADHMPAHEEPTPGVVVPEPSAASAVVATPPAPAPAPTSAIPMPASTPAPDHTASVALAIPDYDSLSASQVVPRLSSLSPEELEAVRAYEDAHRGRKTILNKIAQIRTV